MITGIRYRKRFLLSAVLCFLFADDAMLFADLSVFLFAFLFVVLDPPEFLSLFIFVDFTLFVE